jgi:hypothetical protein
MKPYPKPIKIKRRRPKSERRQLVQKLDDVTKLIVKTRDGWQCVQCGSRSLIGWGHVIPRGNYSVRWDLDNLNAQCNSCNLQHNHFPNLYIGWYIKRFGLERWNRLNEKAIHRRMSKDWTVIELRDLLEKREKLLEIIQHLSLYDEKIKWKLGLYG